MLATDCLSFPRILLCDLQSAVDIIVYMVDDWIKILSFNIHTRGKLDLILKNSKNR